MRYTIYQVIFSTFTNQKINSSNEP